MDFLKRKNFLISLIVILVVMNIASLFTVWMITSSRELPPPRKGEEGGQRDILDFMQYELELDSLQQVQIAELRDTHFSERREAEKYILDARREIIRETIKDEPDTVLMKKYAELIGGKQQEIEMLIYDHFNSIKLILRPEQVERFDQLMHEMIEKNPPPQNEGRHGPPPRPGDKKVMPPSPPGTN